MSFPKLLKYLDAEQVQMKMLEDQLARLQQTARRISACLRA